MNMGFECRTLTWNGVFSHCCIGTFSTGCELKTPGEFFSLGYFSCIVTFTVSLVTVGVYWLFVV